ncbi:alpha-ketoglutarate-dependent dioxygenase AlkB family protein [Leptothermofonsia sichuanensis]|uniref:alpha-ketoglutarate-dependent dioxygenase AlkB family protein n=1 Tax=Leptothermofonsia sichuanensis TaxID=2917832 RepID=UPI001EEFEF75
MKGIPDPMDHQLSLWEPPDAGQSASTQSTQSEPGQVLELPDAEVIFYPHAFSFQESCQLFAALQHGVAWKQESTILFNRSVVLPRLTAWYGDAGKSYTYSHITMQPEPWIPPLLKIKARIEAITQVSFNSVLLNLYRTGRDSISWHSDDEPELGPNPAIGSVSFGATRRFRLRHRVQPHLKAAIDLTHGSFLLMQGPTQHFWQHQVPKTSRTVQPRINLTFRHIGKTETG